LSENHKAIYEKYLKGEINKWELNY
jgi:hypothetical protein